MELTDLMPPMVLSAITKVWIAPINKARNSLASIVSGSCPLWWSWRQGSGNTRKFLLLQLISKVTAGITDLTKLQINGKIPSSLMYSRAACPTNHIYVGNGFCLQFSQIPRRCLQVPVHKTYNLLYTSSTSPSLITHTQLSVSLSLSMWSLPWENISNSIRTN